MADHKHKEELRFVGAWLDELTSQKKNLQDEVKRLRAECKQLRTESDLMRAERSEADKEVERLWALVRFLHNRLPYMAAALEGEGE